MRNSNKTPLNLAKVVSSDLRKRHLTAPPLPVLTELFEVLYYASLIKDEAEPIVCHVVYVDPSNPDPDPPLRIRRHRWTYTNLTSPISLSVSSLVKVSKASDPRTSSLAIHYNKEDGLFIWGFVDQGNSYHEYLNFNNATGFYRPGVFQASIAGIGHLIAYRGPVRIAELNVNTLLRESHDVLRFGPVSEFFQPGIQGLMQHVRTAVGTQWVENEAFATSTVRDVWVQTLCRILLRVRNYRHGGAILIAPENTHAELDIKYRISYPRILSALTYISEKRISLFHSFDKIRSILTANDRNIPGRLYLEETVARNEMDDAEIELDGAVWFVSLLSRVDGLVLLDPDLCVRGFGVEICEQRPPPAVFRAATATATKRSLRPADYHHFGTRHRSMMRYCFHTPGSLGFVISQDGDVRVMMRKNDALVYWESIRLQHDQFTRVRPGDPS